MKKATIVYIHTLDCKPAFYDGDQVCFANCMKAIPVVETLEQIRDEQRKTVRWRKARGWRTDGVRYGFQKIIIP